MTQPVDLDGYTGTTSFGSTTVVIIGTGPVGVALRTSLRRQNRPVVMLESGGAVAASDTSFNMFENVGLPFTGVTSRARGLGGNSALWAGQCMRFHAGDFERRDWVDQSGWPIGYDTMAPYYAEAERFMGVSADTCTASTWRDFGLNPEELPDADVETRFSTFAPEPNLWEREHGTIERDPLTTVIFNATVTGFTIDDGRVAAVEVRSAGGRSANIHAPVFVLAVGAIEAARLLLLPSSSAPNGLAAGNDHVGAHFQDHPHGSLATIRPNDPGSARRALEWFTVFHRRGVKTLPKLALSMERQQADQVLNACAVPVYEWPDGSLFSEMRGIQEAVLGRKFSMSVKQAARTASAHPTELVRYGLGRMRGRSYAGLDPETILLQVYLEQDPATASRVSLGSKTDGFGAPLVRVDWRLGEREQRTALALIEGLDGFFTQMGVGRVEPVPQLAGDDWTSVIRDNQHHAGTTRMSSSPRSGVVDEHCAIHGASNVYVAGGGVFPTSSYANPTLTMIAIAMRVARHIGQSS